MRMVLHHRQPLDQHRKCGSLDERDAICARRCGGSGFPELPGMLRRPGRLDGPREGTPAATSRRRGHGSTSCGTPARTG